MRKLKLDLDELTVESFTPEPERREPPAGTVRGYENHTRGHESCYFSCQLGCTADMSCYNPCVTNVC